jgi:hypothetical protein
MSKKVLVLCMVLLLTLLTASVAFAAGPVCDPGQTVVKGHCEKDGTVVGHYTQDAYGCHYVVNYRGDFGGDPYLDNGRIMNMINCPGGSVGSDNPNAHTNYTYMFVSEGEPQWDENNIWGTWDWDILTVPGEGNVAP